MIGFAAALCAVPASAQPYRPEGSVVKPGASRAVSVYIDNSFSMESVSKEGTSLDEAKNKAREIALAGRPADQFQLLTNDFEARHQRLVTREQFQLAAERRSLQHIK